MKRKNAISTVKTLLNDAELSLHIVAARVNFYKWLQSNGIEEAYIEWLNLGKEPNDHEAFSIWWSATILRLRGDDI